MNQVLPSLAVALVAGCTGQAKVVPIEVVDPAATLSRAASEASAALDPSATGVLLGRTIEDAGLRDQVGSAISFLSTACRTPPRVMQGASMRMAAAAPLDLPSPTAILGTRALSGMVSTRDGSRTPQRVVAELVVVAFGGDCAALPPAQGSIPVPSVQGAIYAMDFLLNAPRVILEPAIADRPSHEEARAFVKWIGDAVNPGAAASEKDAVVERLARAMDASQSGAMLQFARAIAHLDATLGIEIDWRVAEAEPVPAAIQGAIQGQVLAAQQVDGIGWVVIGGLGDNAYDMGAIAGVLDPGGNDTYRWTRVRTGSQGIIDLAGHDRYEGTEHQGPASGFLGLSFIDDAEGNDHYSCGDFGCGAGILGAGMILDRTGDDRYSGASFSLGAGAFGVGAIVDQAGNDVYESASYSQGLGGPLGFGAILDTKGNDLYRADGRVGSAYDLAAVFYSMSQGIGFGARQLCAGGTGLLVDGAGDDRYEAGEFSQGGAYYHAFGALIDVAGDDLYRGDRYSQGFAAHQGAGVLIDLTGNDTYWATTAASQGAAWDESMALLLDACGDDIYRGALLSQGAAAHQSAAALVDLSGSDRYQARGPCSQGASGDNGYHFAKSHTRSVSVLVDLGPGDDVFSEPGRLHGIALHGPWRDADSSAGASLFGFSFDLPSMPVK